MQDTSMITLLIAFYYRDTYPMILVANKVDLVQQRKVTEDDGRTLATRLNVRVKDDQRKEVDCMMEQYIKSWANLHGAA